MTKVLIIDDERPIRSALRDILEYEKIQVEDAATGLEGLDKFSKDKFDLVLCDIKMPGIDGIEVLEKTELLHVNPKARVDQALVTLVMRRVN